MHPIAVHTALVLPILCDDVLTRYINANTSVGVTLREAATFSAHLLHLRIPCHFETVVRGN